jgi:choline dehydrogenase
VTGLEIQHGRCTGIRYLREGQLVRARASREVIVCAGAIGSARLLLLSGIGPADHLRAAGIDPVADVPAVGEHLQDHPAAMACYACPGPLPPSGYNHGEVYAALRSGRAGAWPDLHLFPLLLPVAPAGYPPSAAGYALVAAVVDPDSQGTVRLACADPRHPPQIDPGFLRERRDLDALAEGLALARHAAASAAFAGLHAAEVWPGPDQRSPAGLRSWILHTVASYYHPAGTCRMGTTADAVVDTELRVRGLAGLRVADASVMPVIPNAPLSATVLAIAEKAADLITRPYSAPS